MRDLDADDGNDNGNVDGSINLYGRMRCWYMFRSNMVSVLVMGRAAAYSTSWSRDIFSVLWSYGTRLVFLQINRIIS